MKSKPVRLANDRVIRLVNLTAHPIKMTDRLGNTAEIGPSGHVVRLGENRRTICDLNLDGLQSRIDAVEYEAGELPEPQPDMYYIVSSPVFNRFPDRSDLLLPHTRRNKSGIVGCDYFVCREIRTIM